MNGLMHCNKRPDLFDHLVGDPQQTTRNFALWGALTSATLAMLFRMRSDPLPCCGF
jgi:hypothetical protein